MPKKRKKTNSSHQVPFYTSQLVVVAALIYVLFPWQPSIKAAENPVVNVTTKPLTQEEQCKLDTTTKELNNNLPKRDKLNPCVTVAPPAPAPAPTPAPAAKAPTVTVNTVLEDVPQAVQIGQQKAAARGWTGADWDALYQLWMRESGWNPRSANRSSGACGIPQAYPCSKIPDKSTAGQIEWGLNYIANRYGSPSAAWSHWLQAHSY